MRFHTRSYGLPPVLELRLGVLILSVLFLLSVSAVMLDSEPAAAARDYRAGTETTAEEILGGGVTQGDPDGGETKAPEDGPDGRITLETKLTSDLSASVQAPDKPWMIVTTEKLASWLWSHFVDR